MAPSQLTAVDRDQLLAELLVRRGHCTVAQLRDLREAAAPQAAGAQDATIDEASLEGQELGDLLIREGMVSFGVMSKLLSEVDRCAVVDCGDCAARHYLLPEDLAVPQACDCGAPLSAHKAARGGDATEDQGDRAGGTQLMLHTMANAPAEVQKAAGSKKNLFSKYVLTKELGRGGMGVVYKAWDSALSQWVALKFLRHEGPKAAASADVQRFLREARMASSLKHPNIVTIFDVRQEDERYVIAMPFVDGRPLRRMDPGRAAEVTREVALALEAAHQAGVVHRDIKPGNIMVDNEGKPWVLDFGIARQVEGDSKITQTGAVVGSPAYMPPEQAAGKLDKIDRRCDIYALGATLYETLTGEPPYRGGNPLETLMLVVQGPPPPPSKLNPEIPAELEAICLKAMARVRAKRYQTAAELAEDLQRFLSGQAPLALGELRSRTRVRRSSSASGGTGGIATRRRGPSLDLGNPSLQMQLAIGGGSMVLVILLGLFFLGGKGSKDPSESSSSPSSVAVSSPVSGSSAAVATSGSAESSSSSAAASSSELSALQKLAQNACKAAELYARDENADAERYAELLRTAQQAADTALRSHPDDHALRLKLASLEALLGDEASSLRHIGRVIEAAPGGELEVEAHRARVWRVMRELLRVHWRFGFRPSEPLNEAAAPLSALGKASLSHVEESLRPIVAAVLDGRPEEANATIDALRATGSQFTVPMRRLAMLATYLQIGRRRAVDPTAAVQEAQERARMITGDAQRLMLVSPLDTLALTLNGMVNISLRNAGVARGCFETLLKMQPREEMAHYGMGFSYSLESMVRRDEEKLRKALRHFEKGIEYGGESYTMLTSRATTAYNLRMFDMAEADFRSALKIIKTADIYYRLGMLYRAKRQYDTAIESYEQALAVEPNYYMALIGIGHMHFGLSRFREAVEAYDKVLRIPGLPRQVRTQVQGWRQNAEMRQR